MGRASRLAEARLLAAGLPDVGRLTSMGDVAGLELPGMDITAIAACYGIASERVDTLSDLTRVV